MPRMDLVGSLRNAMEHGSSLQQAMQSLVNAGYSTPEVQDAARYIQTNKTFELHKSTSKEQKQGKGKMPELKPEPPKGKKLPQQPQSTQSKPEIKPKKKMNKSVIIWIIIILLAILGLVGVLFYFVIIRPDAFASVLGG